MVPFDPSRIREAANNDPEFSLAARFWNADIRIDLGAVPHALQVREGQVADFATASAGAGGAGWAVTISATPEQWEQLLAPVPAPFYQDWMAASRHGVVFAGDPVEYGPYYPALRRLLEIMRDCAREG